MLTEYKTALRQLLLNRAVKYGAFTLASGELSPFYVDCRMVSIHSEGSFLIGEIFYDWTRDIGIDAIGGPQVGAIPLIAATVASYGHHQRLMEGFWVRDKEKTYGTQRKIEGNLHRGDRVALLDDVLTTGGSLQRTIEEVEQLGCTVAAVLILVDRQHPQKKPFQYRSVFTLKELVND